MGKIILLFALITSSCIKNDEVKPICFVEAGLFQNIWTSMDTGMRYDTSSCDPDTLCDITTNNYCSNNYEDILIEYNELGGIRIKQCQTGVIIFGNWRVCNSRLEFYNLSNGERDRVFE